MEEVLLGKKSLKLFNFLQMHQQLLAGGQIDYTGILLEALFKCSMIKPFTKNLLFCSAIACR